MTYKIKSKVWVYQGINTPSANAAAMKGAWHFITIPNKISDEVKKKYGKNRRGWGSIPVTVKLGQTSWKTSIFPDKKSSTYLLPLKTKVRQAEGIREDNTVTFTIKI